MKKDYTIFRLEAHAFRSILASSGAKWSERGFITRIFSVQAAPELHHAIEAEWNAHKVFMQAW